MRKYLLDVVSLRLLGSFSHIIIQDEMMTLCFDVTVTKLIKAVDSVTGLFYSADSI